MAYANIRNIDITDTTNPAHKIFQHIRDFVCKRNGTFDYSSSGIGWTLHDSSYAVDEDNITNGDWIVLKSTGEGGKEQIYFHLEADTGLAIKYAGYMYWNNSTHTGVQAFRNPIAVISLTSGYEHFLSLYGDLDGFFVFHEKKTTTSIYGTYTGRLADLVGRSTDIAYPTGALSSGSDVSITVDIALPSDWVVGKKLMIMDEADGEVIEIKTVNAGTKNITADLTNSYSANARLSRFFPYVVAVGQSGLHTCGFSPIMNVDGTTYATTGLSVVSDAICDYIFPSDYDQEYYMSPLYYYCGTTGKRGVHGKMPHLFRVDNDYLNHGDILTYDSVNYRVFAQYSNSAIAVKEV